MLATLIYAAFFLLIGLPLALVLVQAIPPGLFDTLSASAAFSLEPLQRTFGSLRVAISIIHSLELAAAVAVSATALGGATAVLVQRTNVPLRSLLAALPWLVFLTPSYLKALAWVLLMSPGGYLAQLGLLPSGASHAFFALPAEVLSDFGMASTIARLSNFGVLTYGIYAAASDYPVDFPLAGAQALILLALILLVVCADRLLRRKADPRLISGRSRPSRAYDLGILRWPAAGAALLVGALAFYMPLIAIIARAVSRTLADGLSVSNLTADNLVGVISVGTGANGALVRSLYYSVVTAAIACVVALLLSVQLDRANRVMRPLILGLSLGAVAIPGIVLGFGYILVWNRLPGFRDWPFPHYGDGSLLVTGYVAAALPYCLVIIAAAVGQLAPSLFDAARLQGIGAIDRLLRITLPLVLLSVVTAFLLTFIRTVFELPISQMLIPISGPPAPPMILRLFSHDRDGPASALSLAAMAAAGIGAALVWLPVRRASHDDRRLALCRRIENAR